MYPLDFHLVVEGPPWKRHSFVGRGAWNSKLFQLCNPGIFVFFSHSLDFQALKTPVPLEFQACKSLSPLEFHYFVGGPCNFDVFPTPLESQSLNVSTPLGISRSQSYKFVPNCPITLIFPIPPIGISRRQRCNLCYPWNSRLLWDWGSPWNSKVLNRGCTAKKCNKPISNYIYKKKHLFTLKFTS